LSDAGIDQVRRRRADGVTVSIIEHAGRGRKPATRIGQASGERGQRP